MPESEAQSTTNHSGLMCIAVLQLRLRDLAVDARDRLLRRRRQPVLAHCALFVNHYKTVSFLFNNDDSYYLMVGKRINSVTYHVTYGADGSDGFIATDGVPLGVDPTLDFLVVNTDAATQSQAEDSTFVTLGARWDFHDSAAVKFEYTDFSNDLNSDSDAGLLRMAIVTVF